MPQGFLEVVQARFCGVHTRKTTFLLREEPLPFYTHFFYFVLFVFDYIKSDITEYFDLSTFVKGLRQSKRREGNNIAFSSFALT